MVSSSLWGSPKVWKYGRREAVAVLITVTLLPIFPTHGKPHRLVNMVLHARLEWLMTRSASIQVRLWVGRSTLGSGGLRFGWCMAGSDSTVLDWGSAQLDLVAQVQIRWHAARLGGASVDLG